MPKLRIPLAVLVVSMAAVFASVGAESPAPAAGSGDAAFRREVNRFVEEEFRLHPERATDEGDHRFDERVTDWSADGGRRRLAHAVESQKAFAAIEPRTLSPHEAVDREWLLARIDGEILRETEWKTTRVNPGTYLPTAGIYGLIKRDFAPAPERMRLVTAREHAALANLAAAHAMLTPPETPKVSVDIALRQMTGTLSFFRNDLPAAFASVPDGPDKKAFAEQNARLVEAIESYGKWLKDDLLPKADGHFAIGAAVYQRMLADDDMVETPISRLEEIGRKELDRLLAQFRETAAKIDPAQSPGEVYEALARRHPDAPQIVPTVKAGLEELRAFVVSHRLATLPSEVRPIVQETPPFARATSFASMDTPGPFEKATQAYFNVTLPDPSWKPEQAEQLLEFFSAPSISNFSAHEVFPGHYAQFLNNRLNPDSVRALFASGANAEGWALYCEEMMLDQGLHAGDPAYRLAQIQAALQRACRYLAGIALHTEGMTVDDAAAFFQKNAFMTPHNAMVEALRGTQDPGYLRYQLGKLMIVKLRDEMKAKEGGAFDLGRFHDAFLKEGAIPIALIRRELLGSDGPAL
jgi:uncharacterized protein (DUF885 family)